MKYIDADKIRAEIEWRIKESNNDINIGAIESLTINKSLRSLLSFLDTLQEPEVGEEYALQIGKETHILRVGSQADIDRLIRQEEPEIDLEKEMDDYIGKHFHTRFDETLEVGCDPLKTADFVAIARHFAKWGAEYAKIDVTDFCKPIDPGIAQCIADHSWEMLGEDEKPVPNDFEEPNKDLEEAAHRTAIETLNDTKFMTTTMGYDLGKLQDIFIAGAEWMKAKMMEVVMEGKEDIYKI